MWKRMILMLSAMTLLVAGLGAWKFQSIQAAMAQSAAFQPPPEAVTTIVAHPESWDVALSAIGTATAVRGVMVSADLPGIVERIDFESGRRVRQGDVLVKLDTRQEEAQLKAAEAELDLTRLQLDRFRGLRESRVVSQAEYDTTAARFTQAEARVAEIRATIDRKTIRAPFAGVLGIRLVDLGQYMTPGSAVVPLQSLNPIYVDFGVPQQQAGRLRVGTAVHVTLEGSESGEGVAGGPLETGGRITAIDAIIDAATRNVQVQATLDNTRGSLRPGMFVKVRVAVGASVEGIPVPASSISYAPYGNSVFVVEDTKAPDGRTYLGVRQQFVELGDARGDQVAVLAGVKPGEVIVTSGVFKLRNGTAVLVNNQVQPGNDPAPTPDNS